jgi:hypothetical protein
MRNLVLMLALVAACSDDPSPTGVLAIDDLAGAFSAAACDQYVRCGLLEDAASCAGFDDRRIDPNVIAAVQAGSVIFHPDDARACIDGLTASCDRDLFVRGGGSEACDAMFEGTVAAGGGCALSEECKSLDCDVPSCPDACCRGTCVGDAPAPWPRLGEACASVANPCSDGVCDQASGLCVAYRQTGEACASKTECGPDNACANSTCTPEPTTGESCTPGDSDRQCRNIGETCSASTSTCEPFGRTGDACNDVDRCSPQFYVCGADATCRLRPVRGEACDDQTECLDASYCDATTLRCTAPKPDDAACTSDRECESHVCDASICVTPAACF